MQCKVNARTAQTAEFLQPGSRPSCYFGAVIDVLRREETSMTLAAMLGVEARIVRAATPTTR
jgi:hypothetical protein